MTTSIIIPTYNGLTLLKECIDSIRRYTETPYEIIVIDNGSTDGTVDYCGEERLLFVSLPDNAGFPVACNLGMRMASGDTLLLLNNDVVVSHHWLSNMLKCLESMSHVGIVGPMTNYVSGRQKVAYPYSDLAEFHRLAKEVNISDPVKWKGADRLVGFCLLFKREVMERIGYLDEQFSPGHYEDDDYCFRAKMCGYSLMMCGDTLVHHHGSHSFKEQFSNQLQALVKRNYSLFVQKWNVDPHIYI